MEQSFQAQVTHRFHDDGSIDSICSRRFKTIVSSRAESELAGAEQSHRCDPYVLKRRMERFLLRALKDWRSRNESVLNRFQIQPDLRCRHRINGDAAVFSDHR